MPIKRTPSSPPRSATSRRRNGARLSRAAAALCATVVVGFLPAAVAHAGPGADSEVAWAQQLATSNPGDASYTDGCLKFVGDAANASGIDFRSQINVAIGDTTYPDDLLGTFTGGTWSTDQNPPAGAWVFWSSSYGHDYSHVALSLGNGQLLSTNDSFDESGIHQETLADHAYAQYDGWWLPAGA